ncbi:hypothetical protein PC116_g12271 [Phytophthora cactorum]|uniref:DDE Tnp4 domain-containing protein n=1 Tax=Phytophthora cactorum TaxID=29920 RepID=A0A8T1KTU1_9STRA|nr:hypothetical protein Pcac1_g26500 [Phytophthora cactorum]KAG2802621.1 hypothetical protein PC112_g19551 [Phytophthora cactorum]KAG2803499.1 hypothetical protein PC111_g18661 [Phytophthora cactorum]KAG2853592.1 hypothetical protein PC113_g14031 [Phytophthora cactorum]KAG2892239.1 hypothetical protein PC115_g18917 [Phytophthora cactorum]
MDDVLPFLLDLNGEELYMLLTLYDHPERPIIPDIRFNLASLADANAEKEFRFDVRGVLDLARLFELPEFVITSERDKAHKTEAVCILLARLSYPNRNYDLMQRFGRSPSALSRLFSHIVLYVYDRYQEIIYFQKRVCAERIQMYCDAVHACGAPMKNVFGFIDGTKIPVCRPSARPGKKENLQKQVYSGHKHVHCMNFQAVVVPDSLAIHCWGRWKGAGMTSQCCVKASWLIIWPTTRMYLMATLSTATRPTDTDVFGVGLQGR